MRRVMGRVVNPKVPSLRNTVVCLSSSLLSYIRKMVLGLAEYTATTQASVVRRVHDDPRMRLSILHPDPCLRSNLWVGGAKDDVAHTVTPSRAAISSVPVTIVSVPFSTEGNRNSPGVLVEAEDDVLAWLALAPFVTVIYIGVSTKRQHSFRCTKYTPCPEMTPCRLSTCAFSASQKGASLPRLVSSPDAWVEPEPNASATVRQSQRSVRAQVCTRRDSTIQARILGAVEVRLEVLDDMSTM